MSIFGGEASWLNVTNAALGAIILALVLTVAWSVVRETMSPKKSRRVSAKFLGTTHPPQK